jgi:cytochrome c553
MLRLPAWRPETHLKPRHLALPVLLFLTTAAFPQEKLPIWAYPAHFTPGSGAPSTEPQHLPGSKASYTKAEIGNIWVVPDWYPDAHPPMPEIVAHGRKPDVYSCGHCHLPNGQGRPENASVAGLPAAYIIQQMADFKSGARKGSDPEMLSVTNMEKLAKSATDEDVQAAAAYFSSIKPKPWIRVVEVEEVPKTKPAAGMMVVVDGGGKEPIGDRVIEVSEDLEKTELRDPTSGFIAYVPKGSLEKGKALVTTGGNGTTMACTMCHGPDLRGTGSIPSIAGRSPSQMTRQLIDFQLGNRNGSMAPMMKGVVTKLSIQDIVAITGYLASQTP